MLKAVLSLLCGPNLASARELQLTSSRTGLKIFHGRTIYLLKMKFKKVSPYSFG